MASRIEWTGETWNPIVGCSLASPGCTNCYAMRDAYRKGFNPKVPHYHGLTRLVNGKPVWTGKLRMAPGATLVKPLHRKQPTTYFVNSMSDLFHEAAQQDWIDHVLCVMALCPQHTFQVLTKRVERMLEYFTDPGLGTRIGARLMQEARGDIGAEVLVIDITHKLTVGGGLPNVWLGVSVEDQRRAEERIPVLMQVPAAIRFLSCEPLLGPIDLDGIWGYPGSATGDQIDHWPIHWVIAGGESGPGRRPIDPDWIRSLRDQCALVEVPFFGKQLDKVQPLPPDLMVRQMPERAA